MASGSLGNQTTIFGSYTPTFTYSNTTNTPTVANISAQYALYDSRLLVLNMRYNITSTAGYASNSNLRISLPPGIKAASSSVSSLGVYFDLAGFVNFTIRTTEGDNILSISYRIDGNYSASRLSTGYQGIFAVIPVKPA